MTVPENLIYLNNAASAWPRAPGVVEAVARTLDAPPEHPGRAIGKTSDIIAECRCHLAAMLDVADAQRVVLTTHATHALNLAIAGLGLASGERAVVSVAEHNSVLRPLARLEETIGLRTTTIGLDADGWLDRRALERALEAGDVRLVALNHMSNVTGRVQDVAPLFALARRAGARTLLDASQSLGHVAVHPEALNADLVAFTGHKALRGPAGAGGLYVAPGLELEQIYVGGTGVRSDLRLHPPEMPMRLEAGTPNLPALAGLSAALRWIEREGEAFREREKTLGERLRQGLLEIPGVHVFDASAPADKHVGVVSFRLEGWTVEETGYVLGESFGIICRAGLHCAPLIHEVIGSAPEGTVRLSVSGFNTPGEIERALEAVERLAK